ncbi:MAG: diguanylate cyclase, partial [Gammaproteobacteria bacterium]|nr:diguanylate cyclase [Gammaproteobacteria bacterium]
MLGAIILGAGLFILISKPLSRLASVSQALPLLAKQEYGEVRNILGKNSTTNRIDELDQLEYSTKDLTIQLEELHNSIKERSQTVLQRSLELQHERDFIKSLIDTAQLIIITLDQYCNITSFNDFAERTTGYLEQNIINTSFQQFFPSEKWPENEATLIQLKEGQQTISQQESEFIHSDGSIHIISWLHSSLNNPTDSSVVLSVGLDITDKKQSEEQIAWLADHDVLTELYNRRRFNIEFERILNQSIRSKHHGSLLFLDLDQFKDINDSFGHLAGDHVLQKVALTLKSIARTTDVIARLGGDEFAIILSETDAAGTVIMAKKITETLASLSFQFDNNQHKITTSVGIVNFPITGASIE